MVATWEMELGGYHVESPTAWQQYQTQNPKWWGKANVVDGDKPWSAITAAHQMFGGDREYVEMVGAKRSEGRVWNAPYLRPRHWHVVQRWKGLDQGVKSDWSDDRFKSGATGHTYLAFAHADGRATIVQSSVKLGFRVDEGTWEGTAGLDGYCVSVVALPNN